MSIDHNQQIRESYGRRAPSYNDAHGGWHVALAQDFVDWLEPKHGETALDLACGTGLVTLPLARRLGPKGEVVAVDLTPQMIQVGQEKLESLQISGIASGMAPITWLTADITSEGMLSNTAVQRILDQNGGFDMISICSALVLLPNQRQALQFWVEKLLKKGGRIIVDVPTEDMTLHFLLTYHLPAAIGLSDDLSKGRLWIKDERSLANLFEQIGLTVDRNTTTRSYLSEVRHGSDEETGLLVFEQRIADNHISIKEEDKLREARNVWPRLWKQAARGHPGGEEGVEEAHRLYVCIGHKS